MDHQVIRNRFGFGLGTLGRDMVAAMVSMYLMFYLTDVLNIADSLMGVVTVVFVGTRIFDAVNDPLMGVVVDNTRSRWGKFKPWIVIGALAWGLTTILLYIDTGLTGAAFIVVFTLTYLLYEVGYTINDIAFWSMLPALTRDQKERERIGAVARICANIGLFALVVAIVPVTTWLAGVVGSLQRAYLILAISAVILMWLFSLIPLVMVREAPADAASKQHTSLRELFSVIVGNDQLLWMTLAMLAFMTGYTATTSFGLYYFTYIFGDQAMYSIFAAILGITQIIALLIFPLISKKLTRRAIHLLATCLITSGYVIFWFADNSMIFIAVAGLLLFAGQGFIQLLMLMYIADCVEYGEWKLGRRNESITLSLQPLIYKGANAIATGLVGVTLIFSGVKAANGPDDVTADGAFIFKIAMMAIPALLVIVSYLIAVTKYRIDEAFHARICADIAERATLGQP